MNLLALAKAAVSYLSRQIAIKSNPVAYVRSIGVDAGEDLRVIALHGGTFGGEPYLISLGNHVTITGRVQFITHDGGVWVFRESDPLIDCFAPIRVGNNVFIGFGSIILPGAVIGNNVVIAAGSVVRGVIPDNCVAGGVPARVIKSLVDYKARVDSSAIRIRGLPESEKQRILKAALGSSDKRSDFDGVRN